MILSPRLINHSINSGIDEVERTGYVDEINRLKREIEKRDKRSESPKRAEKIKRRTRLKEGVRLLKVRKKVMI